jgi:hypothetical protein
MSNYHSELSSRDRTILRYVRALDAGNEAELDIILDATLTDPELDQAIEEINCAYQEELQITSTATDAQVIQALVQKHFPSAFDADEDLEEQPLIVGEIAARLQADRRVPMNDREVNRQLLKSNAVLPAWLSIHAVQQLAKQLNVQASDRYWRNFRDVAITLGMGRGHNQSQLAAAREKTNRKSAKQSLRPSSQGKKP